MRRFLIASVLSLAVSPAFASSPLGRMAEQMAAACRADCLSQHATRTASSATQLQACTLRCSAASSFSQIHHPGARQAQGRGAPVRPAATPALGGAMPRTAAAPVALAAAPVAAPTAAQMGGSPLAQPVAAGALHGVIFAARTPSSGYGLVVGQRDRLAAHRQAEEACRQTGAGCRAILEFTQACGAVAQGVRRAESALFITSDPRTFVVTSTSAGAGLTRAQAEAEAVADCRMMNPSASCRVVASNCGPRG
jgi:hypothetical protein